MSNNILQHTFAIDFKRHICYHRHRARSFLTIWLEVKQKYNAIYSEQH